MLEFLYFFGAVAIASLLWTLHTMKRDGYFDKVDPMINERKKSTSGSIVFLKDSIKHVK